MKTRRRASFGVALAALILTLSLAPACGPVRGQVGVAVTTAPPATRVEVIGTAPGPDYIWIDGHWGWQGGEYIWVGGRWDRRPHANAKWVPGHWKHGRRGWIWSEGHWR
jgi:hypothetical protein